MNNKNVFSGFLLGLFKKILRLVFVFALIWALITYYPAIKVMLLKGQLNLRDATSTVEIRKIAHLNTLHVNQSGTLENKTKALFNITANTLWADYEFSGIYGVDMDNAYIKTYNNIVNIYLPNARLTDYSINVSKISRQDFLKPISPEDMILIIDTFKEDLHKKYENDIANIQKARENAFNIVVDIIKGYLGDSSKYEFKLCDIGG